MYGSSVPKDLNLPAVVQPPPQMSSTGLLRYRSAPSNLLGEVCAEEDHRPVDHAAADLALARFLAGQHTEIRDSKPPRPTGAAHFPDDAASMTSQQHQQQQQLLYQSQQQQQQQQMAAMEGLYRTLSSGGTEPAAAVGAGNSLLRQSSSPAGFLNHLKMDHGYGIMLRAGFGAGAGGFRNGGGGGDERLKGQLSFSSRQGSVMSQISEMGSDELGSGGGGSSPEAGSINAARSYSGVPPGSYQQTMGGVSSGWDVGTSLAPEQQSMSGVKRHRGDPAHALRNGHQKLGMPGGNNGSKPSAEMAAIEKFLQFQDAVPCKIRAKRGCATHPRSIAERVRRTRISERIRKLQELVPNMEKQTNTADMLDLAVDYVKDLQKQVKVFNDNRAACICSAGKLHSQFVG